MSKNGSSQKRNLIVTAADGQTGHLLAELLLTDGTFSGAIGTLTALCLDPNNDAARSLAKLGANVVPHKPGRLNEMAKTLKAVGADTICVIPPTHVDKVDITTELVMAARKAGGISNVLLISSAGADLADEHRTPRLREFVGIEALVMAEKGVKKTDLGHSPVVIRAGFYAENLLLYAPQVKSEGIIPLPIGESHKFAPVALGDVVKLAAHVLTGFGQHGFSDMHRGQLITITGPMMAAGNEIAEAASKALGQDLEFEDITEAEARRVLKTQAAEHDESEREYLLEYYRLVKEGKTNYISTLAFHAVTGEKPQELEEFFKVYQDEFKGTSNKRRRTK